MKKSTNKKLSLKKEEQVVIAGGNGVLYTDRRCVKTAEQSI